MMKLRVPPCTIQWYPPGYHCIDSVDGDIFLIDHGTLVDDVIRLGQEALTITEPELKGYTWCEHTATRRGYIDGEDALSEMGWKGYERRILANYAHRLYAKVHFEVDDVLRANAVANDVSCEGLEYGWEEYPPLVLDGLTGAQLACTFGDAIICSTKETLVMMGLGLMPDRLPSMVVPARIAYWVGANPSIMSNATPTQIIVIPGIPQAN